MRLARRKSHLAPPAPVRCSQRSQAAGASVELTAAEIAERVKVPTSLMPEGLRDLIAHIQSVAPKGRQEGSGSVGKNTRCAEKYSVILRDRTRERDFWCGMNRGRAKERRASSRRPPAAPEAHKPVGRRRCAVRPPGEFGAARAVGRRLEARRSCRARDAERLWKCGRFMGSGVSARLSACASLGMTGVWERSSRSKNHARVFGRSGWRCEVCHLDLVSPLSASQSNCPAHTRDLRRGDPTMPKIFVISVPFVRGMIPIRRNTATLGASRHRL